jgi:Zn-dependent peptidase ImmA (M78 family)
MNLDRMELADCGTSEALVAAILKQVPDMPIPVPIKDVAMALGIVEIKETELTGFEGGLIAFADKSEGTILVNDRSNPQRRRFTVGHELGHFLNPWHLSKTSEGFRCTTGDMRASKAKPGDRAAQMEVEANRFAAELLFPKPWFDKEMAKLTVVDVEHILALANRYDMSKEATARRYVDKHRESCAAVVSQNGKVLRVYRHSSFPFVEPERDSPVPSGSATARMTVSENEVTGWNEVDGGVWLGSRHGRRSPKAFEQVLGQQNGFRLTLITLDDDDTADDEEDVERAWSRPTFHR